MPDLAIVLTVRAGSDRFPGKCFITLRKRPLIHHIIKRLKSIENSQVIVATTRETTDDRIVEEAEKLDVPVHRGEIYDVVMRVDEAVRKYAPESKLVFRALADMPFLATELLEYASKKLLETGQDAFVWSLPPDRWPVYGAREFPYSREGWRKLVRFSSGKDEREHVDLWFHRNRQRLDYLLHEMPKEDYFRPYRLEVDYKEDGLMISALSKHIPISSPLLDVIEFLDKHEDIAKLNQERVELTGPLTSYNYAQHRLWQRWNAGRPIHTFSGELIQPPHTRSQPIHCKCGQFLGFGGNGELSTSGSVTVSKGNVTCPNCGTLRNWREPGR